MKGLLLLAALAPACAFAQAVPGHWKLTWADEFNKGTSDLKGWTYDLGNRGGWGNGESEVYTKSPSNIFVKKGSLHIAVIADGKGGYTSSRIKSDSLFSQAYGLFEFRAKLPTGTGLWPALWMMPKDSAYGGWPRSGEIDVLESTGQNSTLAQGTLHTEKEQTQKFKESGKMPAGFSTNKWHTYDLEWIKGDGVTAATIRFYIDGILYSSHTGGWVVPPGAGRDAPFDKPFYIIMNMAVGGNYVGKPDLAKGTYELQVDYVRAYLPRK